MKIVRVIIGYPLSFITVVIVFIPCLLLWGFDRGLDKVDNIIDFWFDFID